MLSPMQTAAAIRDLQQRVAALERVLRADRAKAEESAVAIPSVTNPASDAIAEPASDTHVGASDAHVE